MTIEFEHVTRRHGAILALDDLTLSVGQGELLSLLGPSGSGKTTALRVLAGLDTGFDGRVRIAGRDVTELPARTRGVGFVFQSYALFRHMTIAENVAFGLRVRPRHARPARSEIRRRVMELLEMVQMEAHAARYPDQLSGGQRQRVAFARALAIEPTVLLLDEPFGALDPPIRHDLRRTLRRLHDSLGLTTLLVTHDREEAFELSDRVAVLGAGRLHQVGTAEQLDRQPADRFVIEFLGDSIALPGQVRSSRFVFDGLPLAPLPTDLPDGAACAFIRPEEIRLRLGAGPARVIAVERKFQRRRIEVDIAGRHFVLWAPIASDVALAVGACCTADFTASRILRDV